MQLAGALCYIEKLRSKQLQDEIGEVERVFEDHMKSLVYKHLTS
jgi:hypothetical protein